MANKLLELIINLKGNDKLSPLLRNVMGLSGGAQSKLHALNKELAAQKSELKNMQKAFDATKGNAHIYGLAMRDLEAKIEKTTAAMKRQRDYMGTVQKYNQSGQKMRESGTQDIARGTMMAAPYILAMKQATDFQANITTLRQKSGASLEQSNALQSKIINIADDAMTYPQKVLAGMENLMSAGLDENAALKVIAPISKATTAYNGVMEEYTNAIFAQNTSLKTKVEDTEKSLNIMSYASKVGKFDMDAMAKFMPILAAQAGGYKQTGTGAVADISAASQAVERVAGNSDLAGNWLNNLYGKIYTEETEKKFAKQGMKDYRNRVQSMIDGGTSPLEAITLLAKEATKGDLSKLPLIMQDMQAQGAIRGLWQNMDYYRQVRSDSQKPENAQLDADMAMRSGDINTQFSYIGGQATGAFLNAMKGLMPAILPLTQKANELMGKFAAWSEKNPQLLQGIVKVTSGIIAFNLGLGALKLAGGNILPVIGRGIALWNKYPALGKAVGGAFKFMGSGIGTVFKFLGSGAISGGASLALRAFSILRGGAFMLARGLMQAGMMMLANPMIALIVAIGVAIGVAGYLIYKNWDKIKKAFGDGLNYVRGLYNQFTSAGGHIIQGLIDAIMNKIALVKQKILDTANAIKTTFTNAMGIKSPSRVFMEYGNHIVMGAGLGISRNSHLAIKSARNMATGIIGAAAIAAPAFAAPNLGIISNVGKPTPSIISGHQNPKPAIHIDFSNMQINVTAAPGQNADELARAIRDEIDNYARQGLSRSKSNYWGD